MTTVDDLRKMIQDESVEGDFPFSSLNHLGASTPIVDLEKNGPAVQIKTDASNEGLMGSEILMILEDFESDDEVLLEDGRSPTKINPLCDNICQGRRRKDIV